MKKSLPKPTPQGETITKSFRDNYDRFFVSQGTNPDKPDSSSQRIQAQVRLEESGNVFLSNSEYIAGTGFVEFHRLLSIIIMLLDGKVKTTKKLIDAVCEELSFQEETPADKENLDNRSKFHYNWKALPEESRCDKHLEKAEEFVKMLQTLKIHG